MRRHLSALLASVSLHPKRWSIGALLAGFSLLASGCISDNLNGSSDKPIAEAFAGPISLPLRSEINPAAAASAHAKHGEKLQIVQVRRRFVRVRTPRGETGWTDSRNLLTAEQMARLAELAKDAERLPSQGQAMVFNSLNMHTDPSRQSTSFYQITEGMRVDVVGHRLAPRTNDPAPVFKIPKAPQKSTAKKSKKEPATPPPPRPEAPGLPRDWRDISRTVFPPPPPPPEEILPPGVKKRKKVKPRPAVPMEDWYLVRTADHKAGWILARLAYLAIPDEVAQYSEGARITSYAALGDIRDGDQVKQHWVWTTIRDDGVPHEFDSFRIFTWVVRKHRYETAYIERSVEGYYPLSVKRGAVPQFSLITRDEDGQLHRKTYLLEGYLVRKIEDEIYTPPKNTDNQRPISELAPEAPPEPEPGFLDRVFGRFR